MVITSLPEIKPRVGLTRRAVIEFTLVPVVAFAVCIGLGKGALYLMPGLAPWRPQIALGLEIFMAVMIVAGFVILTRRHWVGPAELGLTRPKWRLLHVLWQAPTIFVAAVVVQTCFAHWFDFHAAEEGLADRFAQAAPIEVVLIFVVVAGLVPLWEEFLFRGVIFGALRQRWGIAAAVLVSAFLFAVAHLDLEALPFLLVGGLGAAWLRIFHRNLWAPIIEHSANNAVMCWLVLASVS